VSNYNDTFLPIGTAHEVAGACSAAACQVDGTISHGIQEAIKTLQRDFRERVSKIRSSLVANVSLTAIKDLLKELPAGEVKDQVGHLLSNGDNYHLIMSSNDIDQLFVRLSSMQAWDFLHPQLLEYFVQELADYEIKKIMNEYKSQLVQFRRRTTMSELSGWFGDIPQTSGFQKVVLSLGDNWKDKTYEEFEVLRVSLLRQRVFFRSSLHLCGVLTGSVLVALAISEFYPSIIQQQRMLSEHSFLVFLVDNDVSAIYFEGLCLIRNSYSILANTSYSRLRDPGQPHHPELDPTKKE
jgi:hypothetical protein